MIPIPSCANPETWAAFCEMRRSMGRSIPFTDYAAKLIIAKLELADGQGYDANAILDEAIEKGWRSVFWNDKTPRKKMAESPVLKIMTQDEPQADPARVADIMSSWRKKRA